MTPGAPIVVATPDMRDSTMGIVRSLSEAGLLRTCVTTLAVARDSRWLTCVPNSVVGLLARTRRVPDDISTPFEAIWWRELLRLVAARSGLNDIATDRIWEWAQHGFDRDVARRWAGRAPCIYGCEHAALETFRQQRTRGGLNLHWQVIAHHRTTDAIVREESERFPEASTPYLRHAIQSQPRVGARKQEQLELADLIVCNSDFVRRTCVEAGLEPARVVAVPSACPQVRTDISKRRERAHSNLFVYAGTLSLRKGVPYLLDAWRKLRPPASAELWLIGRSELPPALLRGLPDNVRIRGAMPHTELLDVFERAGVLVFPTLCEGRARVVLEAAASGLALLTTTHSGCEDMIEAGVNGWLVGLRDSDALAERIAWFLEHPEDLPSMWQNSLDKAGRYGDREFAAAHATTIRGFLSQHEI